MSKGNLKNESLMRLASYFSVATALLLIGVVVVLCIDEKKRLN